VFGKGKKHTSLDDSGGDNFSAELLVSIVRSFHFLFLPPSRDLVWADRAGKAMQSTGKGFDGLSWELLLFLHSMRGMDFTGQGGLSTSSCRNWLKTVKRVE
jgi:hypothetical protein